jgi:hypothetical protein
MNDPVVENHRDRQIKEDEGILANTHWYCNSRTVGEDFNYTSLLESGHSRGDTKLES